MQCPKDQAHYFRLVKILFSCVLLAIELMVDLRKLAKLIRAPVYLKTM